MQFVAYNDAIKRFKFQSRYMAFIDGDEFIYPKTERSIIEVVDEILSKDPNAAGLAINWQLFGSNGQEKADYSRGVLERFMQRAPKDWAPLAKNPNAKLRTSGNAIVKIIANPRKINLIGHPHYAIYFSECYSVNEIGKVIEPRSCNFPVTADKIVINHYNTKSHEEYLKKISRGAADGGNQLYTADKFCYFDQNDEFDDGILKYRAARAEDFSLEDETHRLDRVTEALTKTLTACADGKILDLETALTCCALSTHLREHFPNDASYWRVCEETSLGAILKSFQKMSVAEAQLFIRELPKLLSLPYPAAKELRNVALHIIPQMMSCLRIHWLWREFVEMDYLQDLMKLKEV